jgi:hypothetical protein
MLPQLIARAKAPRVIKKAQQNAVAISFLPNPRA